MPLSTAERVRRYRERLKNNPEKAEEVRIKNLERLKMKKKKISQMSEKEKEEKRKMWREVKRKQRAKAFKDNRDKSTTQDTPSTTATASSSATPAPPPPANSTMYYLRRKCKLLAACHKRAQDKIIQYQKNANLLRQRLCRYKKKTTEYIKKLEETIEKMKAREEILESTLQETYKTCEKRVYKDIMKRVIQNSQNKTYVKKLMGLGRKTKISRKKKGRSTAQKEIEKFYLKDTVSRATAGKKECKTEKKQKEQKRYLVDTIANLYKKYKEEGGKYGMTTFWKYKPFYVLSPQLNCRNTCLCMKHCNIDFKFQALKNVIIKQKTVKEVVSGLMCEIPKYACATGKCNHCKDNQVDYVCDDEIRNKPVSWWQWERIDHEYKKKENNSVNVIKTKKTVKTLKTGSYSDLIQAFDKDIRPFRKHVFIMNHQQNQYQYAINNLKDNEALIICDFSENYDCKMKEEVQPKHFGASQVQVTLQTGVVFWKDKAQSFCTLSDNNGHKPENIWAHLYPVLEDIKKITPQVTVLHFYSDGPTSQYRQKGNFYLLNRMTKEMGFTYSTWSFFESGHGKGVADAIGGSIKRALDKRVTYGNDITNAQDAYDLLQVHMKSVQVYIIDDSRIEQHSENLSRLITLTGTLSLHQIITLNQNTQANTVRYRDLSCFCGILKGLCSCYETQTHTLMKLNNAETVSSTAFTSNTPTTSRSSTSLEPALPSCSAATPNDATLSNNIASKGATVSKTETILDTPLLQDLEEASNRTTSSDTSDVLSTNKKPRKARKSISKQRIDNDDNNLLSTADTLTTTTKTTKNAPYITANDQKLNSLELEDRGCHGNSKATDITAKLRKIRKTVPAKLKNERETAKDTKNTVIESETPRNSDIAASSKTDINSVHTIASDNCDTRTYEDVMQIHDDDDILLIPITDNDENHKPIPSSAAVLGDNQQIMLNITSTAPNVDISLKSPVRTFVDDENSEIEMKTCPEIDKYKILESYDNDNTLNDDPMMSSTAPEKETIDIIQTDYYKNGNEPIENKQEIIYDLTEDQEDEGGETHKKLNLEKDILKTKKQSSDPKKETTKSSRRSKSLQNLPARRSFKCNKCHYDRPLILATTAKCMACKLLYCSSCVDISCVNFGYLCDICLEG